MDPGLYFKPVNFEIYNHGGRFSKLTLGYQIQKDTLKSGDLKKGEIKVALIGVPNDTKTMNKGTSGAPGEIRKHLYQLSNIEGFRGIVDFGDLHPGKKEQDICYALRDIVEYLNDSGIVAVVMGGGQDLSIGIARAFREEEAFTMSVVDSRVDLKTGRQVTDASNFLSRILDENPKLFHLQMIGIQSHQVSPSILKYLRNLTYDYVQLGQLRDDLTVVEPILRNTTFLSFDISAIKNSDASGYFRPSPNGLYGEEACQILRYAGLSNKLMVLGLFEVNPVFDPSGLTSGLAAQMIWYFAEALAHRRKESPSGDKAAFTKYFVEMESELPPITFYYHPSTKRWWIEIAREQGDNWIIPCRETDYLIAAKQEIPDIWWKYARKTDKLSKY